MKNILKCERKLLLSNANATKESCNCIELVLVIKQHLHMHLFVARPMQKCKSELNVGAGLERVR